MRILLKLLDKLMRTEPHATRQREPDQGDEHQLNLARVRVNRLHDELAEIDAGVTFAETLFEARGGATPH